MCIRDRINGLPFRDTADVAERLLRIQPSAGIDGVQYGVQMPSVRHDLLLPYGKTRAEQIPAQILRACHGLEHQMEAGIPDPRAGLENGRDGFAAHARHDDVVGFPGRQGGEACLLYTSRCV